MNMNQKGFINLVIIILVVTLAGVGGYLALVKKPPVPTSTTQLINNLPSQSPPPATINNPPATTPQPIPKVSAPITFQEIGGGCGNIFVYKINKDNTAGISVSAREEQLNLSTTEKTFEIGNTDSLNIEILVREGVSELYCNDMLTSTSKFKRLIGKSGKATISISSFDKSQPEWNRNYTATVILKDVHFAEENGNNSNITVDELIFKDIRVGWLPG